MNDCPVYHRYCSLHGFIHGAEAEDLRKGVEKIAQDIASRAESRACDTARDELRSVAEELLYFLEKVDARDSTAFLEAMHREDPEAGKAPPWIKPGVLVWYRPTPSVMYAGRVAGIPQLLGPTWVVQLDQMALYYARTKKRTTVPAAVCDRLMPRFEGP